MCFCGRFSETETKSQADSLFGTVRHHNFVRGVWQHKPVQPFTVMSTWLLTREGCNYTHLAGEHSTTIRKCFRRPVQFFWDPPSYVRNLLNIQIHWSCIYAIILGSRLLHLMYVRNLSNSQVPSSCIHTIMQGSSHKHVMYVRNLSNCQIPWSFIYTFILMSILLSVAYVGNLLGTHITWSCISTLILGASVYMWYM